MASSSYLKSQRRQIITERDTLVKRKKGVDSIMNKVSWNLDESISNVNNMTFLCASYLSSGLSGRKKNIAEEIQDEIEKYPLADGKISSCNTKLGDESARCQSRIDTLNSEIISLDYQIQQAEQREEEERRRAMEAYLASLTGGGKNE